MDYSITPEEHELRAAREKVENAVNRFDYALELESIRFDLGWQSLKASPSVVSDGKDTLTVIFDVEKEDEEFEKKLLRGLLEIEFFKKAEFDESIFNWQEVLKFAYVKHRVGEIMGEGTDVHDSLEEKWPELREELGKRTDDFSEQFYMSAAILGESLGERLLQENDIEEIPSLNRSDVIDAGDELFG